MDKYNTRALRDVDLIARLIGSQDNPTSQALARALLMRCGHNLRLLARMTADEIHALVGIGRGKSEVIATAFELARRINSSEHPTRQIVTSRDGYLIMRPRFADLAHEEFWCLYLNRKSIVVHEELISVGTIAGTLVCPQKILRPAIERHCTAVMLFHNHPSGDPRPSQSDLDLTRKLVRASEVFDIQLLDHIIMTETMFYSFADEGNL